MQYTCVLNAKKKKKKKRNIVFNATNKIRVQFLCSELLLYREYSVTQSVFRLIDVDRQ